MRRIRTIGLASTVAILAFLFLLPAVASAEDRCARCGGAGSITETCSKCGGSGIEEEHHVSGGGVVRYGCEACGGWRGDGIYTGRQGSGSRSTRCPDCDGTGLSAAAVAERRERERAAAAAYARRLAEEERRRTEERERELREKNEKLQRELKTSGEGALKLKTKETGAPHDAIYGNVSRDTGEGFTIKRSIVVDRGEIRISDLAFEQLRGSTWLMGKAEARGKDDEEARFLKEQAEKALAGARLEVVVPSAEKTPAVTALIGEYKDHAVQLAINESRAEYFGGKRGGLEGRITHATERAVLIYRKLKELPPDETAAKEKKELEEQAKAVEEEGRALVDEWAQVRQQEEASLQLARLGREWVGEFLRRNSTILVVRIKDRVVTTPEDRQCHCGGEGCHCIRPLCNGTRSCGCTGTDCACPRVICRFAGTTYCCFGRHQDGNIERCQGTCACTPASGECECTASCNCPRRRR